MNTCSVHFHLIHILTISRYSLDKNTQKRADQGHHVVVGSKGTCWTLVSFFLLDLYVSLLNLASPVAVLNSDGLSYVYDNNHNKTP